MKYCRLLDRLITPTNKLSSIIRIKWHAHVAHTAKHMNMVGGPGPGSLGPLPLNPALIPFVSAQHVMLLLWIGSQNDRVFLFCLEPVSYAVYGWILDTTFLKFSRRDWIWICKTFSDMD